MHYFGPEIGGGAFAPNFTERLVVDAHGVVIAHVAHKQLCCQPKASARQVEVYPSKINTLSKCFGGQNGKLSFATMHF